MWWRRRVTGAAPGCFSPRTPGPFLAAGSRAASRPRATRPSSWTETASPTPWSGQAPGPQRCKPGEHRGDADRPRLSSCSPNLKASAHWSRSSPMPPAPLCLLPNAERTEHRGAPRWAPTPGRCGLCRKPQDHRVGRGECSLCGTGPTVRRARSLSRSAARVTQAGAPPAPSAPV